MKGKFKPKNKKKYLGNASYIVYRSSWELKYMMELDRDPNVVAWQSEEISIPYRSPVDKKIHRYYPDFVVKYEDGSVVMFEIKPYKQTLPPVKKTTKVTKSFITEAITYEVNSAKWVAAREYCAKRNWTFEILTEKELKIVRK